MLAGDPADVAPLAQAVWMRGASLTMLQQPTPRTDLAVWLADTNRAANTIGAVLTVVGSPFGAAEAPLAAAGQNVVTLDDLRTGPAIEPLHVDDSAVAMYQLTSGSTGTPKAVQLTHANLFANSVALFTATEGDASTDVMVSWLPLSHDMGMLAFLTHPMQWGVELVAATPEEFLRRPALWPDLITRYRGAITVGTQLRLRAARPDPGPRRAGPIRPVQLACRDQRRRTHRRTRRAPLGPGRCPLRAAPGGDHLRVRHGRGHPRHHASTLPAQVNVDLISRRDLHESPSRRPTPRPTHAGRIGRPPGRRHGGPRRRRPGPTTPAASRRLDRGSRRCGVARLPHRERLARRADRGRLAVHR